MATEAEALDKARNVSPVIAGWIDRRREAGHSDQETFELLSLAVKVVENLRGEKS